MTECCMTAKKPRKGAIHFLKDFFRDTTQRKERAFYTVLPGKKNNTGRESIYPPGRAAGRGFTFIVIGQSGRSERFCGKCQKYKQTFSARRTSRKNKTDEAALLLENTKYTVWKTTAQKYPLALQKCTLSGKAGG